MSEETLKVCTKCGAGKPLEAFSRYRRNRDGRKELCKSCASAANFRYREQRREEIAAKSRAYYQQNRKEHLALTSGWKKANPEKLKAGRAVLYALEVGRLIRSPTCEECGREGPVQGHHEDYSKPLVVVWLCPSCHRTLHAQRG